MITGIIVENFKSIEGKEVIKFNDLTFFIGPNNSGKSTATNVLDFLNTLLSANPTLGKLLLNGMNSNKILGKYGDAQSIMNYKNKKKDLFSLGISFQMEEFKKEMTASFTFDKNGSLVAYTLHDSNIKVLEFHEKVESKQNFKINYSYLLEEFNTRFSATQTLFYLKDELKNKISDRYGEDMEKIKLDIDQEIRNVLSVNILKKNYFFDSEKEKDLFIIKHKIDKTIYRNWILYFETLICDKSVYSFLNEYTVDLNNPIIVELNRNKDFKKLSEYLVSCIEDDVNEVIDRKAYEFASDIEAYSEDIIRNFEISNGCQLDEFNLNIHVDVDDLIDRIKNKENSDFFKMSFFDYYGREITLGSNFFGKKYKDFVDSVLENTSAHYLDFKDLLNYINIYFPKILRNFIKKYLEIPSTEITDTPLFIYHINDALNKKIYKILSGINLSHNNESFIDSLNFDKILSDDIFYKDFWFDDLKEIELSTIFSINLFRLNRRNYEKDGEVIYLLYKDFTKLLKGTLSSEKTEHYSYSLLNDSINSRLKVSEKRFFLSLFGLLHIYENKDNKIISDVKEDIIVEHTIESIYKFMGSLVMLDQNIGHKRNRSPYKIKVLNKYATHWLKSANSIVDKYMLNFDFLVSRLKQVHFLSIRYTDFGRTHILSANDFLTNLILTIEKHPQKEDIYNLMNSYLQRLELADSLFVQMDKQLDIYKIYLVKDEKRILLSDFGHGTKRILPVLIQMSYLKIQEEVHEWGRHRDVVLSTFFLEEPELGLHPHLQSEFIALIAEHILERRRIHGNSQSRFILETHSEYLIRKLQYLCLKKHVLTKYIDIYYFSKEMINERIKNIKISNDGSLSSDFGKGFFDEADNLAIDLLLLKSNYGN
jgi:predicted ATPase